MGNIETVGSVMAAYVEQPGDDAGWGAVQVHTLRESSPLVLVSTIEADDMTVTAAFTPGAARCLAMMLIAAADRAEALARQTSPAVMEPPADQPLRRRPRPKTPVRASRGKGGASRKELIT